MDYRSSLEKMQKQSHLLLNQMSEKVQSLLLQSVQALQSQDKDLARDLIIQDNAINALENQVLEITGTIIATQQPVTKDMRQTLIAIRMAQDLERMADLSVDIAKTTLRIEGPVEKNLLQGISDMAEITIRMIKGSMESYDREDAVLAEQMAELDHSVDRLYRELLERNYELLMKQPTLIPQGLSICFVGRFLERIADHATNLGENVIYLATNQRLDLNP